MTFNNSELKMEIAKKPKYSFYIIAPFNSRMILDYSCLIGKYERFRKQLCKELNKTYQNQVLIEKFSKDNNPFESIKEWLEKDEFLVESDADMLLFKGTGGSGATQRDKSVINIMVNKKYLLPKDILNIDIFNSTPVLTFESMSFHEYGVGMIYCKLDADFRQEFLSIKEIEPRKIMANLLDKIVRFPSLIEKSSSIGTNVYSSYQKIKEELELKNPVVTYEELFTNQKPNIPLWGHIVLVRNRLTSEDAINTSEIMKKVIEVSHPDGSINFAKGTEGFVHIGWGNSLWAGLNDVELNYAREVLRYIEIQWRTLQVFNEILYRRLNQLASYGMLQKRKIKRAIRWINRLRMEMELYSVNKSNYLQNLAPFPHFIYNEAVQSWRNSQMEEFFIEKLGVFEYLHNRGKEKLQEMSDSKINNILFIFTCLSLVSTFIDGLMFVFAEHIEEALTFRLFLLIFPPVAFIVLIVLIFGRLFGKSK